MDITRCIVTSPPRSRHRSCTFQRLHPIGFQEPFPISDLSANSAIPVLFTLNTFPTSVLSINIWNFNFPFNFFFCGLHNSQISMREVQMQCKCSTHLKTIIIRCRSIPLISQIFFIFGLECRIYQLFRFDHIRDILGKKWLDVKTLQEYFKDVVFHNNSVICIL